MIIKYTYRIQDVKNKNDRSGGVEKEDVVARLNAGGRRFLRYGSCCVALTQLAYRSLSQESSVAGDLDGGPRLQAVA